ncbi:MAG: hypothetical protein ACREWG_13260 [Gammaproteobacteria bacterium]
MLYSDRHGIFTKHDPEDGEPTQFQRAIRELGIAGIQALTPQAKGRLERLFQTLQDRLVKALRLSGIGDIDAANAFLPGDLHNARFAVTPEDPADPTRPIPARAKRWRGSAPSITGARSRRIWCYRSTGSATSFRPRAPPAMPCAGST